MKNPRDYIDEIRRNLQKMQAQGAVTPTEPSSGRRAWTTHTAKSWGTLRS